MPRPLLQSFTAFIVVSICSAQAPPMIQFQDFLRDPVFKGGYVLNWDSPLYTKLSLYGPDAKLVYSLPDAGSDGTAHVHIAWDTDKDGTAASIYHVNGQAYGRIDLLDASGHVTVSINTGAYRH